MSVILLVHVHDPPPAAHPGRRIAPAEFGKDIPCEVGHERAAGHLIGDEPGSIR